MSPASDRRMWGLAVPIIATALILVSAIGYLGIRAMNTATQSAPEIRPISTASLAILPFENISDDPDTDYLSNEIPANIIDKLSGLSGLNVTSRSGAFRFDPVREDATSFGKRLGASVILTGQLNARGESLTIRAELVDVNTNQQLWSKRYARELTDILTIEADITQNISEALRLQLNHEDQTKLAKSYTSSAKAHRALLEGRFWRHKFTTSGWNKALLHFQDAVRIDPDYALAYAELSKAYTGLGIWFGDMPPGEAAPRGKKAAEKAIALDDSLGEAHGAIAYNRLFFDWNWSGAEEEFLEAIRLAPETGRLHLHYSILLRMVGRFQAAEAELGKAMLLNPTFPMNFVDLAYVYDDTNRYAKAIAECQKALDLDPSFPPAYLALGSIHMAKGEYDKAISYLERNSLLRNRQTDDLGHLGAAYATAGKRAKALAILTELPGVSPKGRGQVAIAMIQASLGNTDDAFASLDQAYRERDPGLVFLNLENQFDPLRDDPRYINLVKKLGLNPAPRRHARTKTRSDKIRIAVLPFDDISPKPNEWFANGMTEAVIDDLAAISGLRTTSYTSIKKYTDTTKSIQTIATTQDVDYVVAGSVLRDGNRVSIRARLHSAQDEQIWSNEYQRDMSNVIALQKDIAKAIADSVKVTLTPQEETRLTTAPVVKPEAYEAYMRGMSFVRRGTRQGCESALKLFDGAIQEDPDFAMAYVGRAAAYDGLANYHLPPKQTTQKGKEALRKAIEIDDNLADAHALLGKLQLEYDWDWDGAKRSFDKALSVNQSSAAAHLGLATYYAAMDQADKALAQLDMVQELDSSLRYTDVYYGAISFMARDYERSIRDTRAALEIDPDWWAAHLWLGQVLSQKGEHEEAIRHAKRAAELNDSPSWRAMLGGVYAVAGRREEALSIYNEVKKNESNQYACPYEVATIPLGLGDFETTFMEMNRACEARSNCLAWLQVDPRLDPIREDPRFDDLLERVGFEPKHRLTVADAVPAKPSRIRLAILPFKDNSPSPREWLASGLADAISTRLGRVNASKLGVLGPETTTYYARQGKSIQLLRKDLNVDFVLRGSIQTIDKAVRITASLIRADDLTSSWSDEFTGTLDDPFALQSMIAERIVAGLPFELTGEEQVRLKNRYTVKPEAELAYMQGRFFAPGGGGVEKLTRAVSYFEQAIALDPDYALAYCGLVEVKCFLATWGVIPTSEIRNEMKTAIDTAMALDDSLSEVHVSKGVLAKYLDWDWHAAEIAFKRAIQLDPNLANAYDDYGSLLRFVGRYDEAQERYEQAIRLNPVSAQRLTGLGMLYAGTGRLAEAERLLETALRFDKDFLDAAIWLADVRQKQARFDDAVKIVERTVLSVDDRDISLRCYLGNAYAMAGRTEDARKQLTEMRKLAKQFPASHIYFAEMHAALGEKDEAFRRLDLALAAREAWLPHIRFEPGLISIRSDPRFKELHEKMGLGDVDLSYRSAAPSH